MVEIPQGWQPVHEAMSYLGITGVEELEARVLEFNIDAEFDDDGTIIAVEGNLQEVLFELHHRRVGHRPDDPNEGKKAMKRQKAREARAAKRRIAHREKLRERHAMKRGR